MKHFFGLLLLASFPSGLHAKDMPNPWTLEHNRNKKTAETFEFGSAAEGQIDGEKYLGFIVRRISPNNNEEGPTALIFKNIDKSLAFIAKIDLIGFGLPPNYGTNIEIKRNSIYIYSEHAHHGIFNNRYQFKSVGNTFKLVHFEHQSSVAVCEIEYTPSDCDRKVWSGISYNLLQPSAMCWQEIYNWDDKNKSDEVSSRYEKWIKPKNAVRHQMTLRSTKPHPLDGFNEDIFRDKFFESKFNGCHFDLKNRIKLGNRY